MGQILEYQVSSLISDINFLDAIASKIIDIKQEKLVVKSIFFHLPISETFKLQYSLGRNFRMYRTSHQNWD